MALSPSRLYFAYGSNLYLSEMQSCCPTSTFYSIAVLRNYRWLVNERGFANVVPALPSPSKPEDIVWGFLYRIRPFDEELLDKHEGVSWGYSKEELDAEAITFTEDGRGTRREVVRPLVYVDKERVQESYPWPEFIGKMNRGLQEAVEKGIPISWVERVIRSYIPEVVPTENRAGQSRTMSMQSGARQAPARSDLEKSKYASQTLLDTNLVVNEDGDGTTPAYLNGAERDQKDMTPGQLRNTFRQGRTGANGVHQSKESGAHQPQAQMERAEPRQTNSKIKPTGDKLLECYWWKVKHFCRFSDEECKYAHYETGALSTPPNQHKESKKAARTVSRKGSSSENAFPTTAYAIDTKYQHRARKQNYDDSHGYPQDWNGQQAETASKTWSEQGEKEPPSRNAFPTPTHTIDTKHKHHAQKENYEDPYAYPQAWNGQQADTVSKSWGEQGEKEVESEPDWFVGNSRTDVKW